MFNTFTYNSPRLKNPEMIITPNGITPIHSKTRSGKTQNYVKMSIDLTKRGCVVLHITHDSLAATSDAKTKALKLGVPNEDIIFVNNSKGVNHILRQLSGGARHKNYYYIMNGNFNHYNRLVNEIREDSTLYREVPFIQLEDEGHYGEAYYKWDRNEENLQEVIGIGGRKRNMMKLHHITNSHLFMTSATLERAAFEGPPNMLLTSSDYIEPSAATFKSMDSNESHNLREGLLSSERLDWINHRANTKSQELMLFNGVFRHPAHDQLKDQLLNSLPNRPDVCVVLIHKSKIIEYCPSKLVHKTLDVKDVQTAIEQLRHHDGYRYIYCIGHKQCELGQTFADHSGSIGLTVQFIACSANDSDDQISNGNDIEHKGYKPLWSSLAQWVRTGGYTTVGEQTVITVKSKWDDYCQYNNDFFNGIASYIDKCMDGNPPNEIIFPIIKTLKTKTPSNYSSNLIHSNELKNTAPLVTTFLRAKSVEAEMSRKINYADIPANEIRDFYAEYTPQDENPHRIDARGASADIERTHPKKYTIYNIKHGNIHIFDQGVRIIRERVTKTSRHKKHNYIGDVEMSKSVKEDQLKIDLTKPIQLELAPNNEIH